MPCCRPRTAMIYKGCARCGTLVPYGVRYCERCQPVAQQEAEEGKQRAMSRYNAKRESKYAAFYNSQAWALLRELVLSECGRVCELCKSELATTVHHRVPLKADWSKRLDRANMVGVCADCHDREHERFAHQGLGT